MTGIALLTYALEVAADHEPEKNLKGAIANVLDLASGFDQTLREAKLDVMRIEEQEVEFEREILAAARGGSTNTYVSFVRRKSAEQSQLYRKAVQLEQRYRKQVLRRNVKV